MSAAAELIGRVWALEREVLDAMLATPAELLAELAARGAPPQTSATRAGQIGRVYIRGVITRRPSFLQYLFGGGAASSVEGIRAQLREQLADREVQQVVMEIDSPGGTTDGLPELAQEIYTARQSKPITALVDTTAGSAAFWIASQASRIVVTPSGSVGSIGVYGLHVDESGALAKAGVKATIIVSGASPHKVEEASIAPLSDDARASIQARVDAFAGMFIRDVARGRRVSESKVRSDFGQGRMLMAADAVRVGMADAIAPEVGAVAVPTSGLDSATTAQLHRIREQTQLRELRDRNEQRGARTRAAIEATRDLVEYRDVDAVPRALRVFGEVALDAAWRQLGGWNPASKPELRFFAEASDPRATGERFLSTPIRGTVRPDGVVRVNANFALPEMVATVAHEAFHTQQPARMSESEGEERARAFATQFARDFWRSPEAEALVAYFRREAAA